MKNSIAVLSIVTALLATACVNTAETADGQRSPDRSSAFELVAPPASGMAVTQSAPNAVQTESDGCGGDAAYSDGGTPRPSAWLGLEHSVGSGDVETRSAHFVLRYSCH